MLEFELVDPDEDEVKLLTHLFGHALVLVVLVEFGLDLDQGFQGLAGEEVLAGNVELVPELFELLKSAYIIIQLLF